MLTRDGTGLWPWKSRDGNLEGRRDLKPERARVTGLCEQQISRASSPQRSRKQDWSRIVEAGKTAPQPRLVLASPGGKELSRPSCDCADSRHDTGDWLGERQVHTLLRSLYRYDCKGTVLYCALRQIMPSQPSAKSRLRSQHPRRGEKKQP